MSIFIYIHPYSQLLAHYSEPQLHPSDKSWGFCLFVSLTMKATIDELRAEAGRGGKSMVAAITIFSDLLYSIDISISVKGEFTNQKTDKSMFFRGEDRLNIFEIQHRQICHAISIDRCSGHQFQTQTDHLGDAVRIHSHWAYQNHYSF